MGSVRRSTADDDGSLPVATRKRSASLEPLLRARRAAPFAERARAGTAPGASHMKSCTPEPSCVQTGVGKMPDKDDALAEMATAGVDAAVIHPPSSLG